ncbi:MAG: glycosyltransferase [Isosphaeraceae bacterium]
MGHTNVGRSELASNIVPCWNQLEFTRRCMAALMRCTRSPWELIVVNNGSTDGTNHYLAGVQDASPVPVTVVANSTNLGFPAAIDQGLKYARGGYRVLLNNDAVVTNGWLEQLVALTTAMTGEEQGLAAVRGCGAGTCPAELPRALGASDGAETTPQPAYALGASGSAETTSPSPSGLGPCGSAEVTAPSPSGLGASGSAEATDPPSGLGASGSAEVTAPGRPSPPTSCGDLSPGGRGGESARVWGMLRGVSGWLGR